MQFDVSFHKRYSVPRLVISSSISSTSLTGKIKILLIVYSTIGGFRWGGGGVGGRWSLLSVVVAFGISRSVFEARTVT